LGYDNRHPSVVMCKCCCSNPFLEQRPRSASPFHPYQITCKDWGHYLHKRATPIGLDRGRNRQTIHPLSQPRAALGLAALARGQALFFCTFSYIYKDDTINCLDPDTKPYVNCDALYPARTEHDVTVRGLASFFSLTPPTSEKRLSQALFLCVFRATQWHNWMTALPLQRYPVYALFGRCVTLYLWGMGRWPGVERHGSFS
jgi:hypothetical protein